MPGGGRRRTPGLRREELASLAGISTTWYTFLEQGRDVRPSAQVLDALARALGLGDAERTHLHSLAGADAREVGHEDDERLSPEVAGVPAMVEPNPAYVTGRTYDLLAWNAAAVEWFPGACEVERPNLARWIFTDPAARDVLPDWLLVAQSVLARLRASAGRNPGSPRVAALERELRAASPEADAWWPRYDIATSQSGAKRVRTRTGQVRHLAYASFVVSDQPDQVLTIYSPV